MTTITTKIIAGDYPQSVRQKTTNELTGVTPIGPAPASAEYKPLRFTGGRYDYIDPSDYALDDLEDGGIFDFQNEDLPISITEIRATTTAYDAYIEDKNGDNPIQVVTTAAGDTRVEFHPPLVVIPAQQLRVVVAGPTVVDVYVVKGNCRTA